MNIPDKEIERMAYPTIDAHPNHIGAAAVVFLLMGVFWEPWMALIALFPIGMFWTELWNNIRWAREYVEAAEFKKWIQDRVDDAVSSGKIEETIEEMRRLKSEIPNSKGSGMFIKNEHDRNRYCKFDRVIDALYKAK